MALRVSKLNLEAQNFAALIQVLQTTKRANKGIRSSHIPPVIICGLSKEGIRPAQLADSLNITVQAARQKLLVGLKHGNFHKANRTYYLSTRGEVIYNDFMKVFRNRLENLTLYIIRRSSHRLEGYWHRKARELELQLAQANEALKAHSNPV